MVINRCAFLFLILFANLAAQDVGNFQLIFEQKISENEKKLLVNEIRHFSEKMNQSFQFEKRSVTIIKFLPRLNTREFPEWGIGFYVSRENTIYLNMSQYQNRSQFYRVLKHEIVHAWSDDFRYRKNLWPLWFEEGIAEFFSGRSIQFSDAKRLSMAIANKKILSQDSLLSISLGHPYQTEIFYLQSYYIVQLLGQIGKLNEYIHGQFWKPDAGSPPGFRDWIDFEIWWQSELYNSFKWFILLNFDFSIAILFVILFFIVYIIRSFRVRQKWKELQTLEEEDDG